MDRETIHLRKELVKLYRDYKDYLKEKNKQHAHEVCEKNREFHLNDFVVYEIGGGFSQPVIYQPEEPTLEGFIEFISK